MQRYHLESEIIPKFFNKLEDAQAKSNQANNPITDATLFIIATNSMLRTEKLSRANAYRKEINVGQRTWTNWKTTYRLVEKKQRSKIKPPEENTNLELQIVQHNNLCLSNLGEPPRETHS